MTEVRYPVQQPPQPLNWFFMMVTLVLMTVVVGFVFLIAFAILGSDIGGRVTGVENDIKKVIEDQQAAWNRGDLDGFMAGYSKKRLLYISGTKTITSWDALREHYAKSYQTEGAKMGKLTFEKLEVKLANGQQADATGNWKVTDAAKNGSGSFTLMLQHEPEGWKVVVDHTTSDAP